ncbi:coil containing protein [Vibrio phage 1.015.O._10N.222.51.E5]|nr:coil containing protein [Vibrio phage 1.015.O._10N.222.51.E5]
MAQSPFAVNPNSAADIRSVQLTGGYTEPPSLSPLDITSNALKQVTPFLVDRQRSIALGELDTNLQAVSNALKYARYPQLGESEFADEALDNPVVAQTLKEFERIKSAVDTGVLPSSFALARFEEITSNAIADAPHFSVEIKKAAKDTLGFSPQAKFMANLLEKTPQEQAAEQLQIGAMKVGMTVPEFVQISHNKTVNDADLNHLNYVKELGTYTAGNMSKEAGIRASNAVAGIFESAMTQMTASGGIGNPDELITLVNAAYATEVQGMLRNLPGGIDVSTRNQHIDSLNKQRDGMIELIKSGNMSTILSTKNAIIKEMAQNDILSLPGVAHISAIDPKLVPVALGAAQQYKKNPEAFLRAVQYTREGAELMGVVELVGAMDNGFQFFGAESGSPVTEKDKGDVSLASVLTLADQGHTSETYMTALNYLAELNDGEISYYTAGASKIVTNIAGHKPLHAPIINMYQAEAGALQAEYQQLKNEGMVPDNGFIITDGRVDTRATALAVTVPTSALRDKTGGESVAIKARVQKYAERFNRFLETSDKYAKVGVIPGTLYGGADAVLTAFDNTGQAVPEPKPTEQSNEPVVWDFGEDGTLNPVK